MAPTRPITVAGTGCSHCEETVEGDAEVTAPVAAVGLYTNGRPVAV
ncbi:hypothetical protein SAMN04488133_3567 [Halobellus limi]|uniref:Uncharacterized protein n=1 Tax=Halobellus limi TaxID=699433 RepID=A0A1H6CMC1_9EURY|nr:hypothetical protein SAMN04488133_3567 [Halobellus limi]